MAVAIDPVGSSRREPMGEWGRFVNLSPSGRLGERLGRGEGVEHAGAAGVDGLEAEARLHGVGEALLVAGEDHEALAFGEGEELAGAGEGALRQGGRGGGGGGTGARAR